MYLYTRRILSFGLAKVRVFKNFYEGNLQTLETSSIYDSMLFEYLQSYLKYVCGKAFLKRKRNEIELLD